MKLKNLTTNFLGKNSFYYETIDSTQKEIWRRVEQNNVKDGTVIFSDLQTLGIGTHGRKWYTDEKNNIAFSLFLDMNCSIESLNGLTMEIAEVVKDIFKTKYNIEVQIKQPNDIYCCGKKIGGILTETKIFSGKVKYLVIGIGINTNKNSFCKKIEEIATSIYKEFEIHIDTKQFIVEFCNEFENRIVKRRKEK